LKNSQKQIALSKLQWDIFFKNINDINEDVQNYEVELYNKKPQLIYQPESH